MKKKINRFLGWFYSTLLFTEMIVYLNSSIMHLLFYHTCARQIIRYSSVSTHIAFITYSMTSVLSRRVMRSHLYPIFVICARNATKRNLRIAIPAHPLKFMKHSWKESYDIRLQMKRHTGTSGRFLVLSHSFLPILPRNLRIYFL